MGTKLNEKDLDNIIKEADKIKESSKELKMMEDIEKGTYMSEEETKKSIAEENKSEEMVVERDLITGKILPIKKKSEIENEEKESSHYTAKDCLNGDIPDYVDEIDISNETIKNQLKEDIKNITDEDAIKLAELIERYRKNEKFKLYEELPTRVKGLITKQLMDENIPLTKEVVEASSEALISNIISGIAIDQYEVEFEDAMNELINEDLPEVSKYVIDSIKKRVKLLRDKAKEIMESGDKETSEKINAIADSCEDAYGFTKFKEALKNHSIKMKKFDIEKCDRIFRDFDLKYENSPYKTRSISVVPSVLNRVLDVKDYTNEHLVAFTVAFCKLCMNYKPSDPIQHSYMYYTIQSIIYLDIKSEDKEFNEFKKMVMDNVKECLDIIDKDYNYVIY